MLTAAQKPIAMLLRYAVHFVDPEAEVILYGSQARGEADKYSDWDVVVLTKKEVSIPHRNAIMDAIYHVELATDEIVTVLVEERGRWDERAGTFFNRNVSRDGVSLAELVA